MSEAISRLFENGARQRLTAGRPLFHRGDPVRAMYLVVSGEIELSRQTETGLNVILQRARPGQVLAEASAYAERYHCDARACTDTSLLTLPASAFRGRLADDRVAASGWSAYLAGAVQNARFRAEILRLRTVRERLDAWLGEHGHIPERGTWTELAATLGVSREALYREMGRRRREK